MSFSEGTKVIEHEPLASAYLVENVLITTKSKAQNGYILEARDVKSLELCWAATSLSDAVACGENEVISVEAFAGGAMLSSRDASSGAIHWRSPSPTSEPGLISVVDRYLLLKHHLDLYIFRRENGGLICKTEGSFGYPSSPKSKRFYIGEGAALLCASPAEAS
jgi:hypothetical protein